MKISAITGFCPEIVTTHTTRQRSHALVAGATLVLAAFVTTPASAQHSPGTLYQTSLNRIQTFVVGNNGNLYSKYFSGQWIWEPLASPGAALLNSPGAVYQYEQDRDMVFVVGSDGNLYDTYPNGKWVWEPQGHPPATRAINSPSALYQSSINRVQVFVVGQNGHLCDEFYNGQQWVWEDQGPPLNSLDGVRAINSPGAVYQSQQDRNIAFVVGSNGHLYDKYYSNGWIWEDQGTPPGTIAINSPSAIYQSPINRVQVFVTGGDGHLYDKYYNGQQWVWEDQGTPPSPAPTQVINSPGAVYQSQQDREIVFVIGSNGHLYDKYFDNGWIWEDQGLPPATAAKNSPSPIYQSSINRVQVFVVGTDGDLYDKYYNGQRWVWEDQGNPGVQF